MLILPGDGIGPEIVGATERVLQALSRDFGLDIEVEHALVGGAAVGVFGSGSAAMWCA